MRKLCLLVAILAVSTTANAALSLYINDSPAPSSVDVLVDQVLTVQIYSDTTLTYPAAYAYFIGVDESGVGLLTEPDPHQPHIDLLPDIIWDLDFDALTYPCGPGVLFTTNYFSDSQGSNVVSLLDDGLNPLDSFEVNVVPEPMTILMLGVGGLILRKRR